MWVLPKRIFAKRLQAIRKEEILSLRILLQEQSFRDHQRLLEGCSKARRISFARLKKRLSNYRKKHCGFLRQSECEFAIWIQNRMINILLMYRIYHISVRLCLEKR